MTDRAPGIDDEFAPLDSPVTDAQIRGWAHEDFASVVALTQRLIRAPSRGGIDSYEPIFAVVTGWLTQRGIDASCLHNESGHLVGLVSDVNGSRPGPHYVLDACIDTAPFGDLDAWRHPPTAGVIEDGWLHGRGAADSKVAIAIFVHIARRLRQRADQLSGTLTLLFDADEHTGGFGGARTYFVRHPDVAGVMIGYPGMHQLVVGGRGFLRARIAVYATAGHTGSNRGQQEVNAVHKAARLVGLLSEHHTPGPIDPIIGLAPRLTTTAIHGGESYSIIPDRCTIDVDTRLTTTFDSSAARSVVENATASVDRLLPTAKSTTVEFLDSWPAYHLSQEAAIRTALLDAAGRHLPTAPRPEVAGPSNIGNYLAKLGIDATAGLGVAYRGLHGTDECIDLSTVELVQATYHRAVLTLLQ